MRPHVFAAMLVGLWFVAQPDARASAAQRDQPQRTQPREEMRFRGMDLNRDGVISRKEWRGSDQSFRAHDWNGDGVLSGDEVRVGATREMDEEELDQRRREFYNWTEAGFKNLDHNGNNRIERAEWHYDLEAFRRADRNRDGALTRAEFLGHDTDSDREDRFEYLDVNRNGRIERSEWHGSRDAFDWLDRNNDGILSRTEVVGEEAPEPDLFASLDVNRDQKISVNEWHWSRRSFNQQDRNRDGFLTRSELAGADPDAVGTSGQVFLVDATQRWIDTGIDVQAGERVSIQAEGTIVLSENKADTAGPAGSQTRRRAPQAPLREEPAGALIARIGDSTPVLVGQSEIIERANQSGRLYLSVNDDYLLDNRGEFRVTVTTQRRP